MAGNCPGQEGRNLTVSVHKCPDCGNEVEMFSDEIRVKCRNCGGVVYKESVPTCIEWCVKARECLGEERWNALRGPGDEDPQEEPAADVDGRPPSVAS